MTPIAYVFQSTDGAIYISMDARGWWIYLRDERVDGPFRSAQQALDDLAGGHCPWPNSPDSSGLGIPDQIEDWMVARSAR